MQARAAAVSKPISKDQIKIIHTLASKMGLSERAYRQRLARVGVKSCKEMSFEQAKRFIHNLKIAAAKKLKKVYAGSGGYERISLSQMGLVRGMWEEVSYIDDPDAREAALGVLVERLYHVSALNWLPAWQVHKLVKTLEQMKADMLAKQAEEAAKALQDAPDAAPAEAAAGI